MSESNKPQGLQVQFETQVTEQDLMNLNYTTITTVSAVWQDCCLGLSH